VKLNLGCGGKKLPGYINVDSQAAAHPDVVLNIGQDRFPWEDSSIDGVQAWHIFEHLPPAQLFHCLKEIYRVCKPGALLGVIVPHPRHDVFIGDVTHVNAITPTGMLLFSKKHYAKLVESGTLGVTTYTDYIGVDFDLQEPVGKMLDPRIDPESDWRTRELYENNIVVEYRFKMKVVK
jgi:hypothetical protein